MDRNNDKPGGTLKFTASLSARRAWIETMKCQVKKYSGLNVALRKESVDRNNPPVEPFKVGEVALRKESVDRNGSYA